MIDVVKLMDDRRVVLHPVLLPIGEDGVVAYVSDPKAYWLTSAIGSEAEPKMKKLNAFGGD